MYANADKGAIQWGLVFDAGTSSSMHWVEAVCDLMAICGNIEKPGTHVLVHNAFDINAGYSSVDLYADKGALDRKFRKWMVGDEGMDFVGMSNCDAMASVLEEGGQDTHQWRGLPDQDVLGTKLQRSFRP